MSYQTSLTYDPHFHCDCCRRHLWCRCSTCWSRLRGKPYGSFLLNHRFPSALRETPAHHCFLWWGGRQGASQNPWLLPAGCCAPLQSQRSLQKPQQALELPVLTPWTDVCSTLRLLRPRETGQLKCGWCHPRAPPPSTAEDLPQLEAVLLRSLGPLPGYLRTSCWKPLQLHLLRRENTFWNQSGGRGWTRSVFSCFCCTSWTSKELHPTEANLEP